MSSWHMDYHSPGRGLSFQVSRSLHTEQSKYQTIEIVETTDLGTVMLLDGVLMLSSLDEFVYHEMLSQPSLYCHPNPEKVLIIGGGDCGTMNRVLWCEKVQKVIQVEIDEMVTRVSRQFFPQLTKCLTDSRTELVFADGIDYLHNNRNCFDVILVDSTDPVGPAAGLFRKEFFVDCYQALKPDGILCIQSESPWIPDLLDLIVEVNANLKSLFKHVNPYLAAIQTYQAGLWMFQMASKQYQPTSEEVLTRIRESSNKFSYYNAEIHQAAFALPQFVRDRL